MSAALLIAGCGLADHTPRCVMGEEHTVANAEGWSFDHVAVATRADVTFAFWSDAGGLHGVTLDASGKRSASPRRLGDRCIGGLAAAAHDEAIALACLRPFDGSDASGLVSLLLVAPDLQVLEQRTLGAAGRVSRGIDVARSAEGQLAVVWHDASVDDAQLWLWRGGEDAERLTLSSASSIPAAPTLSWTQEHLFVAWAELSRDANEKRQRLVLSGGTGAPTVVTTVAYVLPTPRLSVLGTQLYLSFRDLRDGLRKPGLYVARINERGTQVGEVARVLRANGKAGQAIVPCFGGLLSAAPRTVGGGHFISLNWANSTLTQKAAERQFYEDSHHFVVAAGACLRQRALWLIGEEGGPTRPDARLRSVGFRCE